MDLVNIGEKTENVKEIESVGKIENDTSIALNP